MGQREITHDDHPQTTGPVVYWMSRDQRVDDNWALLYAQFQALRMSQPLMVVFNKCDGYLGATAQHDSFMMTGLCDVSMKLEEFNIPFLVLAGDPVENLTAFMHDMAAGLLVTDFNPLRLSRSWKTQVAERIAVRFVEVDAHNVIPCFSASNKQEFAAYTFRPKVHKMLEDDLTEFPALVKHPFQVSAPSLASFAAWAQTTHRILEGTNNTSGRKSGEAAANAQLNGFLNSRLTEYGNRNNPNEDVTSGLSPYLHFGQISAQRVAIEVRKQAGTDTPNVGQPNVGHAASEFLEELIVRRELADNFCYYNQNYDNPEGFPAWAKKTLQDHRLDQREYLYHLEQLENAATHDRLWNAAQMEMVRTGRMHGYLRMYWAKKILQWSESVEQAMQHAIYLNDTYQLDGRDPNGYTGIAWSMGGVHDRAWGERPVFGKIRYMSHDGCRRKFDVETYIRRVMALS